MSCHHVPCQHHLCVRSRQHHSRDTPHILLVGQHHHSRWCVSQPLLQIIKLCSITEEVCREQLVTSDHIVTRSRQSTFTQDHDGDYGGMMTLLILLLIANIIIALTRTRVIIGQNLYYIKLTGRTAASFSFLTEIRDEIRLEIPEHCNSDAVNKHHVDF